MRFGTWRGVTLAIALAATLTACGLVRANDPFHHSIPTEVEAIDLNTGQPYMAPPIPYGHYAKGSLFNRFCGHLASPFHSLAGLGGHGLCGLCGGKGCGHCGGTGMLGGHGLGHGQGGDPSCGGNGCGLFGGHAKRFQGCGLCGGKGCGICTSTILPSAQSAPVVVTTASPQATAQSAPACVVNGCGLKGGHKHHGGGICGHDPGLSCGKCFGGLGRGCFHGPGATCGNCMGGQGGNGCSNCGGKGCGLCKGGLGGLPGHGLLKGSIYGLLHPHAGKVEYFVGPGGPVPITPGYVPYVNPVRSPRDFFAFPPFTQ